MTSHQFRWNLRFFWKSVLYCFHLLIVFQLTELINELRSDNATLQSSLKRKIEVERSNEAAKVNFDPKVSSFQNVASDAISNLIQLNLDQSQQLNTFIGTVASGVDISELLCLFRARLLRTN